MKKYDFIRLVRDEHVASNETMLMTVDYYKYRREGNAFLCPFHADSRVGNCSVNPKKDNGIAHCFACGANFSSLDVIMKEEDVNFQGAIRFLWEKILGGTWPEFTRGDSKPFFTQAELSVIGLGKASMGYVREGIGMCRKSDDVPGSDATSERDGWLAVYERVKGEPLQAIYDRGGEDSRFVLELVRDKAVAAKHWCVATIGSLNGGQLGAAFAGAPESAEAMRLATEKFKAVASVEMKVERLLQDPASFETRR